MPADAPLATVSARRERDAILDLCGRESGEAMLLELNARLRRIVPFDACFWSAVDPLTSLATSPALVEGFGDGRYCDPYWTREFMTEDFLRFTELARSPRPVGTLHDATSGRLRRSGRYVDVHVELGLEDELRAVFRSGGSTWGIASLLRRAGASPFSAAEQKVLADMSPAIADAFRRGAVTRPAHIPNVPADAPGLLVFDRRGFLQSMNAEAEDWLAELPADNGLVRDGLRTIRSVTEVLSVVNRARAVAAGLDEGSARLRVRGVSGRWIVLHASCLRDASGEPGQVAVVIEAAKASEIAPLIVEAYGLTPREREITEAVSRGEPTAEIAARLHLSPHTVRDHLKAVFEKTGVSSRGELVAHLFAEHYRPALNRDIVDLG